MNSLAVKNIASLHVHRVGVAHSDRLPLALLHGWGSDSACWQPLVAELEKEYCLYLIDLPGFGGSSHVTMPSAEGLLAQLEEISEQVIACKAHWVGWSLGGMLASAFVTRSPERCASLTTIACNAKFVADDAWPNACAETTYHAFLQGFSGDVPTTLKRFFVLQGQGDKQRKKITRYLSENLPDLGEGNMHSWDSGLTLLNQLDNRRALAASSVPHMALFGENDALVPVASAKTMLQENMCDTFRVINESGHAPHVGQPHVVAKALRNFTVRQENPYDRDKQRVAHSFSAAAASYEKAAALQARVAKKLVSLQGDLSGTLCDIGCGTGFCIDEIRPHNPNVIGLDIAPGMLAYCREKNQHTPVNLVCADFENLPLKAASVDGIVSSMSVQWSENLPALFRQFRAALNEDGWLLFSTLGPKTLHELRTAWESVDGYVHVNQFAPVQQVNNALNDAGFEITQCHTENDVLRYGHVMDLMRDLKAIGAHNVNAGKNQGLSTRKRFQALAEAYEHFRSDDAQEHGGTLPATYEVVYCLAKVKQLG